MVRSQSDKFTDAMLTNPAMSRTAQTIDNPRIWLEQAEAVNGMPVEYGGGKEKAKPILLLAKEKFDKFVPADQLAPDWGKDCCETLLAGCSENQ